MTREREKINKLYELYGFAVENEKEEYSVYLYEQGYFTNIEIVVFSAMSKENIQTIKDDYLGAGYSVSLRENCTYQELKKLLFTGFFKIKESKNRVKSDYHKFCLAQEKKLGGIKYSYISSQYLLNGEQKTRDILEDICAVLQKDTAQLIILEAPAGFGKTCTSYEIANRLAEKDDMRVPILAELSKNRSAKIFDYVLLTEIDRKFSKLSSDLVTHQIEEGNIPLIVDGFDELISKSAMDNNTQTEDARTMLDTISSLFIEGGKSKILLTSRKSSIFTGDIFDKWVEERLINCTVTRFQILPPSIDEWVEADKLQVLKAASIQLDSISNPVLLSVLKSLPMTEFTSAFKTTSDILETYMSLILKREKERQLLLIDENEQRGIMRKVAAWFVTLDITSDEPEGIKAIIEDIVKDKIHIYMDMYEEQSLYDSAISISSEDEFIMKLVHNALLDRISLKSNNIGFINEFIFGILIGEAIVESDLKIGDVSEKYLGIALTAFNAESIEKKQRLYALIKNNLDNLSTELKLVVDLNLINRMSYDYVDEYISNTRFINGFEMITDHYFYNCCFQSCIFNNVKIASNLFEGCYFINCAFYNIEIEPQGVEENSIFVSCSGHEELQRIIKENVHGAKQNDVPQKDIVYYEKLVLEQFWMTGSAMADVNRSERTLFKGIPAPERENVLQAIQSLVNKRILIKLKFCYELNMKNMETVKKILGR